MKRAARRVLKGLNKLDFNIRDILNSTNGEAILAALMAEQDSSNGLRDATEVDTSNVHSENLYEKYHEPLLVVEDGNLVMEDPSPAEVSWRRILDNKNKTYEELEAERAAKRDWEIQLKLQSDPVYRFNLWAADNLYEFRHLFPAMLMSTGVRTKSPLLYGLGSAWEGANAAYDWYHNDKNGMYRSVFEPVTFTLFDQIPIWLRGSSYVEEPVLANASKSNIMSESLSHSLKALPNIPSYVGKKLYPILNPVARALSPYRWLGYESKLKDAAEKGIQESIDIFNKYHRSNAENMMHESVELSKPTDYLLDVEFSYLPWDSNGESLFGINGYSLIVGNQRKLVIRMPTLFDITSWNLPKTLRCTIAHEANHNFTLDPILSSKFPIHFGLWRSSPRLEKAYPIFNNKEFCSDTSFERSATNAEIRNILGLSSEEINALPTSKFIHKNWMGRPTTIFDKLKWKVNSSYMFDYAKGVRHALKEDVRENLANGGKGMSEVFPNFADKFANDMKEALTMEYKYGGRLCKKLNK